MASLETVASCCVGAAKPKVRPETETKPKVRLETATKPKVRLETATNHIVVFENNKNMSLAKNLLSATKNFISHQKRGGGDTSTLFSAFRSAIKTCCRRSLLSSTKTFAAARKIWPSQKTCFRQQTLSCGQKNQRPQQNLLSAAG